ncbi:MAG: hypothetical protein H8K03_04480 [Nitrospira sp.]
MRTVLFTGAGASRAIGYPLTRELLPRIRAELKNGELFSGINGEKEDEQDCKDLQRYLLRLLPGLSDAKDRQLPLITDVFSLVEHALISGEALPIGGANAVRHCRDLLKRAITAILLGDFFAEWDDTDSHQKRERDVLDRFARWVYRQGAKVGLVTTNYDIGLEYEVYKRMGRKLQSTTLDLGFDWRGVETGREQTRPAKPELRVYKLHGSLDQLRCPLCGYVYFNKLGAIAVQAFRSKLDNNNTCHCRKDSRLELHIVSPSLVRDVRDANLLSVWRSALEWMRRADRWIIVGYSLPPEDLAVRSLLLRAYNTASKPPQVIVVQHGHAERPRYKLLFPGCHYQSHGLESFLAEVS